MGMSYRIDEAEERTRELERQLKLARAQAQKGSRSGSASEASDHSAEGEQLSQEEQMRRIHHEICEEIHSYILQPINKYGPKNKTAIRKLKDIPIFNDIITVFYKDTFKAKKSDGSCNFDREDPNNSRHPEASLKEFIKLVTGYTTKETRDYWLTYFKDDEAQYYDFLARTHHFFRDPSKRYFRYLEQMETEVTAKVTILIKQIKELFLAKNKNLIRSIIRDTAKDTTASPAKTAASSGRSSPTHTATSGAGTEDVATNADEEENKSDGTAGEEEEAEMAAEADAANAGPQNEQRRRKLTTPHKAGSTSLPAGAATGGVVNAAGSSVGAGTGNKPPEDQSGIAAPKGILKKHVKIDPSAAKAAAAGTSAVPTSAKVDKTGESGSAGPAAQEGAAADGSSAAQSTNEFSEFKNSIIYKLLIAALLLDRNIDNNNIIPANCKAMIIKDLLVLIQNLKPVEESDRRQVHHNNVDAYQFIAHLVIALDFDLPPSGCCSCGRLTSAQRKVISAHEVIRAFAFAEKPPISRGQTKSEPSVISQYIKHLGEATSLRLNTTLVDLNNEILLISLFSSLQRAQIASIDQEIRDLTAKYTTPAPAAEYNERSPLTVNQ
jgi:hypothetical protein